jgi:hypothetical protein
MGADKRIIKYYIHCERSSFGPQSQGEQISVETGGDKGRKEKAGEVLYPYSSCYLQ